MTPNDLMAAIGRLRRAQPRNADTISVCEALEVKLASKGDCPECERRRVENAERVRKFRKAKAKVKKRARKVQGA